ncbi:unnamed protein product [Phytomonas sp. Hart1]|nr:unnamed protein product [Phytomonas sp. Hart1]|eukprot:CCW71818.1 unnamed protein product [Phytomonas sp. isolate Hart1]
MDLEEYAIDETRISPEDGSPAADAPAGGDAPLAKLDAIRRTIHGIARQKARFELGGFIVHRGQGVSTGHYFTCVRYGPQLWYCFDDNAVHLMTARDVQQFFGVTSAGSNGVSTTAYILLYERVA